MAKIPDFLKTIGTAAAVVLAGGLAFALLETISARVVTLATCVPPDDFVASAITRAEFYTFFVAVLGGAVFAVSAAIKALVARRGRFSPGRLGAAVIFGAALAVNVFWYIIAERNINKLNIEGHDYRLLNPDGFFIFAFPIMALGVAAFSLALYLLLRRLKNPRRVSAYAGALALVGSATLAVWYAASRPRPVEENPGYPDVILITLDAWRADSWGKKRQGRELTPFLDAFAAEACVFRNARVQASWTLPSVATIFTSQYPAVHGARPDRRLGRTQATLAGVLAAHGYETFAATGNDLCLPNSGLLRGFNGYYYWDTNPWLERLGYYETYAFYSAFRTHRKETTDKPITTMLTDEVVRQLTHPRRKPLFLWVHYLDPHSPYKPQPKYTTIPVPSDKQLWQYPRPKRHRVTHQLYCGEVRYVDDELRRVYALLQNRPHTLVIFSSDHGEEFGERFKKGPKNNYDIRGHGHGHTVYDEVLRVPLIMKFPDGCAREVETGVGLIDLAPTILEYVGIEKPPSMQGRSLLPVMEGRADEEPVFAGPTQLYNGNKEAVYFDGRKLIYDWKKERYLYFNLKTDPREKKPLNPDTPEAEELKGYLMRWREENKRFAAAYVTGEEQADLEGAMRAMGYIE